MTGHPSWAVPISQAYSKDVVPAYTPVGMVPTRARHAPNSAGGRPAVSFAPFTPRDEADEARLPCKSPTAKGGACGMPRVYDQATGARTEHCLTHWKAILKAVNGQLFVVGDAWRALPA
ncbi:MAG: hypothetical protein M3Q75_15105 [Gemmatimonadota bacterium]|nr:hypothetical protein [Gemmatimonadota bacterium]